MPSTANTEIGDACLCEHYTAMKGLTDDDFFMVRGIAVTINDSISNGGKVIVLGNGGSAAMADHLVGELIGRFKKEREPLPAMSLPDQATLTALSNDYGYESAFRRYVEAFFKPGDVLLMLSTSGNSENLLNVSKAVKRGCPCPAMYSFTGKGGGKLATLTEGVIVRSDDTAAIQEVHLFLVHLLCSFLDEEF